MSEIALIQMLDVGSNRRKSETNNWNLHYMPNQKVPRIELTEEPEQHRSSSSFQPLHSLARVIRESLRLHNVRREKKRMQKKKIKMVKDSNYLQVGNAKRLRSKSMDNADGESCNEISDIGCYSEVVASDCGPILAINSNVNGENEAVTKKHQEQIGNKDNQRVRRLSTSIGENELRQFQKLESKKAHDFYGHQQTSRQYSMPDNCNVRRKSKDDSDINSIEEVDSLRTRFARLMVKIRSNKFSASESSATATEAMLTLPKINEDPYVSNSNSSMDLIK